MSGVAVEKKVNKVGEIEIALADLFKRIGELEDLTNKLVGAGLREKKPTAQGGPPIGDFLSSKLLGIRDAILLATENIGESIYNIRDGLL